MGVVFIRARPEERRRIWDSAAGVGGIGHRKTPAHGARFGRLCGPVTAPAAADTAALGVYGIHAGSEFWGLPAWVLGMGSPLGTLHWGMNTRPWPGELMANGAILLRQHGRTYDNEFCSALVELVLRQQSAHQYVSVYG